MLGNSVDWTETKQHNLNKIFMNRGQSIKATLRIETTAKDLLVMSFLGFKEMLEAATSSYMLLLVSLRFPREAPSSGSRTVENTSPRSCTDNRV